jgi:hypothetical protein
MEMDNLARAELCEAMAEELKANGHCKGTYKDADGRHCLAGAAMEVMKSDMVTNYYEDLRVVAEVLGFEEPNEIFDFNDGPATALTNINGRIIGTEFRKGIDAPTAVDFCIERSKFWRNQ